jgi:hypothetical protein
MTSRLFKILITFSALICLATIALWLRGHYARDSLWYSTDTMRYSIHSYRGRIWLWSLSIAPDSSAMVWTTRRRIRTGFQVDSVSDSWYAPFVGPRKGIVLETDFTEAPRGWSTPKQAVARLPLRQHGHLVSQGPASAGLSHRKLARYLHPPLGHYHSYGNTSDDRHRAVDAKSPSSPRQSLPQMRLRPPRHPQPLPRMRPRAQTRSITRRRSPAPFIGHTNNPPITLHEDRMRIPLPRWLAIDVMPHPLQLLQR